MAGGKGRRLYPFTSVLPKPLVPLDDKPILEIVIRQLVNAGFKSITISVGYLAELIMAAIGDGSKFGIHINYSREESPLNTIGPLTLIADLYEEESPFLVMNGDILTNIDYVDLYEFHKKKNSIITVASYKRSVQLELGVLSYDENYYVNQFVEKPSYTYCVSMGIYILNPRILQFIPKGEPFGFNHLMDQVLSSHETIATYPFQGKWLDMGTMDDLENANEEFKTNSQDYLHNTIYTMDYPKHPSDSIFGITRSILEESI